MKGYFEFYNPVKICAGEDALGNLMYEAGALGMREDDDRLPAAFEAIDPSIPSQCADVPSSGWHSAA